jgi:phosphonate transport system ATP-binding protein
MDLLTEIATADDIPVLINIHEVDLAVEYADRVVGLRDGQKVFEGLPADLDETAKGQIYRGEEIPEGAGPTGKVAAEAAAPGEASSEEGNIRRT